MPARSSSAGPRRRRSEPAGLGKISIGLSYRFCPTRTAILTPSTCVSRAPEGKPATDTCRRSVTSMPASAGKPENDPEHPSGPRPTASRGGSERPAQDPAGTLGELSAVAFLTVAEVAKVMRVSKMTVYRLLHSGELAGVRVGRSFRVPEKAVHEYLRDAFNDTA